MFDFDHLRKDNSGSIVVEASISLIAFIVMLVSIISLINIFIVHNRIQFAINASANQIAAYSYLYHMSSVGEARATLAADGAPYIANLNKVKNGITALQSVMNSSSDYTFDDLYSDASDIATGAETLTKDPYSVLIGGAYDGAMKLEQFAEDEALAGLSKYLTRQYIAPGELDADTYLNRYHVKGGYNGLKFSKSTFTHESGNDEKVIVIVDVTYEVDVPLLEILLPQSKPLIMHQRACAKGWTCGDGNAYKGD